MVKPERNSLRFIPVTQHILPSETVPRDPGKHARLTSLLI